MLGIAKELILSSTYFFMFDKISFQKWRIYSLLSPSAHYHLYNWQLQLLKAVHEFFSNKGLTSFWRLLQVYYFHTLLSEAVSFIVGVSEVQIFHYLWLIINFRPEVVSFWLVVKNRNGIKTCEGN